MTPAFGFAMVVVYVLGDTKGTKVLYRLIRAITSDVHAGNRNARRNATGHAAVGSKR